MKTRVSTHVLSAAVRNVCIGGLLWCWCWWGRIHWNFVPMSPALCWEAQILAFPSHTLGQAHCCIVHASGWGDQALACGAGIAQEDYVQWKQNHCPCCLRHSVPLTWYLCSVFSPWSWKVTKARLSVAEGYVFNFGELLLVYGEWNMLEVYNRIMGVGNLSPEEL